MKTLDDAPFMDFFAAVFIEDPDSFVQPPRAKSGVVRTDIGAVVVRRDLVQRLLADPRLRSSILDSSRLQGVTDGPVFELISHSLLANEGREHLRLRRLVNRAFTPRAVDRHRPVMQEILASLVALMAPRGRCEFMEEIADRYAVRVMCHLLGVPDEAHEDFAAWSKALTWVLSYQLSEHRAEVEWGLRKLDAHVRELVADRRRDPRDDMLTALVQAEEEGDRLSDPELRALVESLLFAGFDTTRSQLGIAMVLFARHPDQWSLLARRPELAAGAVEEVMRIQGATTVAPRVAVTDIEVDGYHLPAGSFVVLSTGSANHDPTAYGDPTAFDITRDAEPQLTFGGGAHYCLGANLARAELQEALKLLVAVMPDVRLDGEPVWRSPFGIFGPERLPLRFTADGV